jgi:HAD superfamily hydrolase (TIGR01548 family)
MRITVPGNRRDFDRLVHGFETALAPEAVFFDMDDTLADVTASYRLATVAAAKTFGVEITFDDITAAKAGGDANNDWVLTRRLLAERGVEVSIEEVTETFEALYQGKDGVPGFKTKETLLCERALIERLAGRVRLGVVTGRPRRDAEEFLKNQGILGLFDVVTTMEDGPPKPDPAPVLSALDALGISRAWMVGDTPDDMRAARRAQVIPIGIVAPADDPGVAKDALIRSGAGRVINDLSQLEELLP